MRKENIHKLGENWKSRRISHLLFVKIFDDSQGHYFRCKISGTSENHR